ncbi:MAG TPA: hypothetical protein VH496_12445 [Mycobacterium sp.]|jgi:hypothetical protein
MTQLMTSQSTDRRLRAGDLVEVCSAEEILATLDERGELENLPFMPEMLQFCGKRLTVNKVAHKLCDTISQTGMHKMTNAVHLTGARCDGASHGGCQAACLIYWKEAWLKKVEPGSPSSPVGGRIDLPLLTVNTTKEPGPDGEARYSCQTTEIIRAAPTCLPARELGQYVADVTTGNVSVLDSIRAFLIVLFNRLQGLSKRLLPRKLWFRDGRPWGFVKGRLHGPTPTGFLDLQPGELVRIKSKEQIEATLNDKGLNRGMGFAEEMARYCGRTARVQGRVTRCLDEKTGKMLTMKNPCILLEDVVCAGLDTANCPRQAMTFWREIWLERV